MQYLRAGRPHSARVSPAAIVDFFKVAMGTQLRELFQYRELLLILTWKEIRVRYKESIMGFFWAILMPSLVVASGMIIKKVFSTASGMPMTLVDIASVSVKAVPWAFFVSAIRFSTQSLVGNSHLVKKIYFPREILPLSAVLTSLFDFMIAIAALSVALAVARIGISIHILWLPVLIGFLILLAFSVGLLLSCANLFFRDVKYLVEVSLTFGIFLVPVFYDASRLGKWATLMLLNPVAMILEAINRVTVLHQPLEGWWIAYLVFCCMAASGVAWKLFHWAQPAFAETV